MDKRKEVRILKINIEAVQELIKEKFDGKLANFVSELDVDYSYMNQIMNGHKSSGSKKVCDGIIAYCKKNKLNYNKYIFL